MNKYVPLPNSPDGKEYLFSPVSTASINQEIFRIDENLRTNDSLFAYGFISRQPNVDDLPFVGATLPGFAEKGQANIYQYTLAWNHTFNGTPLTNIYNSSVAIACFRPGQQSAVYPTAPEGMVYPSDPNCTASGYHTHWDHFGPRVGFAYSLGGSGKTSIRGGFGVYYNVPEIELMLENLETPPLSTTSIGVVAAGEVPSLANPFVSADRTVTVPNPFPYTPPGKGAAIDYSQYEPMSLNVISPNFTVPSSYNYNVTVERELPASMILSVGFVGLQGRHLENTIELNPAGQFPGINPSCVATPGCNANNSFVTDPSAYPYDPTIFGSLGEQTTDANSNYNSLQISVNKHFTRGLQFMAAYGWSHSLDYSSSFENSGGLQNPFARYLSYGDSQYDARNRFVLSYVYSLPNVRHTQDLLSRLTNDWQIAGITTFQSGFPITLSDSSDNSYTCNAALTFYGCWDRPNVVGPVQIGNPRTNTQTYTYGVANLGGSPSLPNYWFNPNSFAVETPGVVGNAGRNFFHGPGINNFDFSLTKHIHIDEARYFELRFEFFNFFNHTDFASPDSNAFDPNFGRVTSLLGLGASQYPAASRIVQLGAKFFF